MNLLLILFVSLLIYYYKGIVGAVCSHEFNYQNGLQCAETLEVTMDLWIGHSNNDGYSFTITPNTSWSEIDNQDYIYHLAAGANYTLEWKHATDSSCDGAEIFSVPNPHFVISQPKCRYSRGTVTFDNPDLIPFDADCQDEPCEVSIQDQDLDLNYHNSNIDCVFKPAFYELSDKYPNLRVQDSYYYKDSGSIQLYDLSKYSSWNLTFGDNPNQNLPESSAGLWIDLKPTTYSLNLQSDECDLQIIPIEIAPSWPSFYLEFGNNIECPRNSSMKLIIDDADFFAKGCQAYINSYSAGNGQSVYFNEYSPEKIEVKFLWNSEMMLKDMYRPDIMGDIQYSVDSCTGIVTLHYDEALYPDVYAYDGKKLPVTDKKFKLTDNAAYVESPCHFSKVYINIRSSILPAYEITKPQQFCGDSMDVFVANYYEFEELTLGEDDLEHDGHGNFKNIPASFHDTISLNYKANQCYETQSIDIPFRSYEPLEYEEIIEIVKYPACSLPGIVSYTIRDIKRNVYSQKQIQSFYTSSLVSLSTSFDNNCSQIFTTDWFSPDIQKYHNSFPNDLYSITKNATCKYSNDGSILFKLNPGFKVLNILINNIVYNSTTDLNGVNFNGLPYGEYEIIIKTDKCSPFYQTISISTTNLWEFPAVVTPVTGDCSVSNGKITYDTSIFTSTTPVSNFAALNSGYHQIDFALSNGSCSGSANIYVPTATGTVPNAKILAQPSCEYSDDGVVKVTIVNLGQESSPTSVQLKSFNTSTNTFTLKGGNYNFMVYNNSCSWPLNVVLKARDVQFKVNYIMDNNDECNQKTFVSVTPMDKNITINDISTDSEVTHYSNFIFSFNPIMFGKNRQFFINYNDHCLKTVTIQDTQDMFQKISWPSIQAKYVDCGGVSTQNTVADITNKKNMTIYQNDNSIRNMYLPTYSFYRSYFTAIDMPSKCSKEINFNNFNIGPISKSISKPICPGSNDGSILVNLDPKSNYYQLWDSDYSHLPVESSSKLNTYKNISNREYSLVKSLKSNLFCTVLEPINIEVNEPTVSLGLLGLCDASNSDIMRGVTNTLSISTTNVTYNINGVLSTNPVFKNLSPGNYSSTATIYNSVCKRVIKSNTVLVPKSPITLTIDTFTCMKAVVTLSQTDSLFKHTIKDSKDTVVHEIETKESFTYTPTTQGTFSIVVSDKGSCLFKSSFIVTGCGGSSSGNGNGSQSPNTSESETVPASSHKLLPSLFFISLSILYLFI
ncbi:hypothetical protein CYY_008420 [Polysphondylium violaceum]|uniref:Uncharacterized protein n=1 Tax=Polysphondylium violaceum TaxID=133409 RepID=A0A8J4UWY4_9MYCE|nr:hypothetical protein CYY_008420 [Polysphondylium violaceum]